MIKKKLKFLLVVTWQGVIWIYNKFMVIFCKNFKKKVLKEEILKFILIV